MYAFTPDPESEALDSGRRFEPFRGPEARRIDDLDRPAARNALWVERLDYRNPITGIFGAPVDGEGAQKFGTFVDKILSGAAQRKLVRQQFKELELRNQQNEGMFILDVDQRSAAAISAELDMEAKQRASNLDTIFAATSILRELQAMRNEGFPVPAPSFEEILQYLRSENVDIPSYLRITEAGLTASIEVGTVNPA